MYKICDNHQNSHAAAAAAAAVDAEFRKMLNSAQCEQYFFEITDHKISNYMALIYPVASSSITVVR
jgi:hypothetical protein